MEHGKRKNCAPLVIPNITFQPSPKTLPVTSSSISGIRNPSHNTTVHPAALKLPRMVFTGPCCSRAPSSGAASPRGAPDSSSSPSRHRSRPPVPTPTVPTVNVHRRGSAGSSVRGGRPARGVTGARQSGAGGAWVGRRGKQCLHSPQGVSNHHHVHEGDGDDGIVDVWGGGWSRVSPCCDVLMMLLCWCWCWFCCLYYCFVVGMHMLPGGCTYIHTYIHIHANKLTPHMHTIHIIQ